MNKEKIKKDFQEAMKFVRLDRGYYFRTMLDVESGEVWFDCFMDCGSYARYHGGTIVYLGSEITAQGDAITLESILKHAEYLTKIFKETGKVGYDYEYFY